MIILILKYLFAFGAIILGLTISIGNWAIFYIVLSNIIKKEQKYVPSFTPFFGGIILLVGLIWLGDLTQNTTLIESTTQYIYLIFLLIDFVSIPWVIYTIFCLIYNIFKSPSKKTPPHN